MGGQACVFYGAAQVSKDIDLLVLAEQENFTRLQAALRTAKLAATQTARSRERRAVASSSACFPVRIPSKTSLHQPA
jgi:hypothetical protein